MLGLVVESAGRGPTEASPGLQSFSRPGAKTMLYVAVLEGCRGPLCDAIVDGKVEDDL